MQFSFFLYYTQRFRADAVALFLYNFTQFTKINSILLIDFLNQLRPLPLGTVLYALGPIIFSGMAAFFKFAAKVGHQSLDFSNRNFAKGELFSELSRVLAACLSFTVTNMKGIEIIIHFIYTFFGEKRQADRVILFTFTDMK